MVPITAKAITKKDVTDLEYTNNGDKKSNHIAKYITRTKARPFLVEDRRGENHE